MQMREKVGKPPKHCVFGGSGGSEGSEGSKNCTPLWREAHVEVKMYKTHSLHRTTFGSWDVEKVHAVVARSTCRSQNVQNTSASDHFWKLRCRKSARRCGAKHMSKSKCTKHLGVGPLLEVEMLKKCTPSKKVHAAVARSRFRSQNVQNIRVQTTFGGSDVASCGRCKGLCTLSKVSKTWGFCSIFNYNRHYTTLHSNTLQLQLQLHLHYIPLHYTPLHYTTPSYTQLHSITLHYMTIHSTTLRYTTLRYLPLHYITLHYTTLHYTPLHYAILHYATLTSTTLQLHYFTLHSTILQLQLHNYTPLHSTTLHYTPLH